MCTLPIYFSYQKVIIPDTLGMMPLLQSLKGPVIGATKTLLAAGVLVGARKFADEQGLQMERQRAVDMIRRDHISAAKKLGLLDDK